MRKLLNIIFIISIIIIMVFIAINIYENYIIPKMYLNNSGQVMIDDTNMSDKLQKLFVKYVISACEKDGNINEFMPSVNMSSEKTVEYLNNIKNREFIKCKEFRKIDDSTYIVKYNVYTDDSDLYSSIIKIYESKNYYRVLYDELYDLGRKVKQ